MRETPRTPRWLTRASAAIAVIVAVASCSVGDQFCREGFKPSDTNKDSSCPYGSEDGPKLKIESCKNEGLDVRPAQCNYTWADIYAMLNDPARGQCTNAGCHGKMSAGDGLAISETDPAAAFEAFTGFQHEVLGTYINNGPDKGTRMTSWFVCNLQGLQSGGSPMPKPNGLTNPSDVAMVKEWFACWADDPAAFGPAGGGVGGGGTGGGGAGGAGGM